MRWLRLYSKVIAFLLAAAMPAFAALPPATPQGVGSASNVAFPPMPSLFGTQEIFHGDTSPFKQWTDMLGRTRAEFGSEPQICLSGGQECAIGEWSRFIAVLAPLSLREKIVRANAALNRVAYVPTTRNWHQPMYWEAPLEFLAYGGQCQDYAIAKYMALRQAGVPAALMRIVVLRATALGEDHAVLVVNVDGEALMLDNLRSGVVAANAETSYRPYYSINEAGWWQHIAGAPQMAYR